MMTIAENEAIPLDERLAILKEAKGGTWYDGWKPYCVQMTTPCASRLERMEQTSYGFRCHTCGNMIGWNLERIVESPLNKIKTL